MAKRNSYKRSYDFPNSAASTHVQNKLRDNNRDALVKANPRNAGNRGVAMLAAAGSSDETLEQVTISAPAPNAKAKAKAKAQPCFKYQKKICDKGDRCPCTHVGEPGSAPELSAEEKKNIAQKRSKIPCNANAAGRCRFGDKCQYMHPESKTFAAGACQDAPPGESEHNHSDTEIVFTAPASSPQMHDPRADLQEVMCGSPTAPSSIVNRGDVREWIIDTGTENHLVSRSRCVDDSNQLFKVDRPLRIATANGEITADQRIHNNMNTIGTILGPLVLDKTVDAISVGRLVLERNFSFHWPSGGNAYLIETHRNRKECETKCFAPVLKHKTDDDIYTFPCALPAVDEVEPQDPAQPDDQAEEHQSKNEKLKTEANSPEHMLLHHPKNPYCWVCGLSKMTAKQVRPTPSQREASGPCWKALARRCFKQNCLHDSGPSLDVTTPSPLRLSAFRTKRHPRG